MECKVISTSDKNVLPSFKRFAHSWNEVFVDGEYKTIDLTPNLLTFMGEPRTESFVICEM